MKKLPNFVVGGAPKSGTTSMCAWLADHPQATCSTRKETFYLLDEREWIINRAFNFHTHGIEGYEKCFPQPKPESRVMFEGTTLYLYQETALSVIPALPTNPKMLFILREPSRRIYSNYQYFFNNKATRSSSLSFTGFLEKVKAGDAFDGNNQLAQSIDHSRYAQYLAPWMERMGRDNVKVWIFERLVSDPKSHMKELCEWLGIDPGFYDTYAYPKENETYKVKNRFLHALSMVFGPLISQPALRKFVRSLYRRVNTTRLEGPGDDDKAAMKQLKQELRPDVEALERLLGQTIPEWR